jgi:hypothetical protein
MEHKRMVMKTLTLDNLTPSELIIYKDGLLLETVNTTSITTLQYDITNGIYLFDNNGKDIYFYLDEETKCRLYDHLCPESNAYYYYTALDLLQSCTDKYEEGVELYNALLKILKNDCDCVR